MRLGQPEAAAPVTAAERCQLGCAPRTGPFVFIPVMIVAEPHTAIPGDQMGPNRIRPGRDL